MQAQAEQEPAPPPVAQEAPPPPRHRHHHRHRHATADAAPAPDRTGDDDDDDDDNDNDQAPPPAPDASDDSDDTPWPKAGSVDPFGLGPQYTTAQIKTMPIYERGHAYKNGERVQSPTTVRPHIWVYRCDRAAGCSEPIPIGEGWIQDGWYDAKAPRLVPYKEPPPLKPGENPYPNHGKPIDERELRGVPRYDSSTTYSFGAMVQQGYVTNPHYVIYRCTQKQCDRSPGTGNGWESYGWYGRD